MRHRPRIALFSIFWHVALTWETMEGPVISMKRDPDLWSTGCRNVPLAKNTQATWLNVCDCKKKPYSSSQLSMEMALGLEE